MIPQRWSRTVFGLVAGGVVLVLVSALLTAAVYSVGAAHDLRVLSRNLVQGQQSAQQANDDAEQRSKQAKDERQTLLDQNAKLQQQLTTLLKVLRDHGITVPAETPPPKKTTPKKPRRPKQHPAPKVTPPPKPTPAPTIDPCDFFCPPFTLPEVPFP